MTQSALIIGASRGLGLAITQELLRRGWQVTATVRDPAHSSLREAKHLQIDQLDIASEAQVAAYESKSRSSGHAFDLLFIAAGVANPRAEMIGQVSNEEFSRILVTNALAPMRLVERLADLVRPGGTIGVMSSGQGSIADAGSGDNDVYRASKAALNMLMRVFSGRRGKDFALLLLAPGWIKTDMGGEGAKFTVEETIGDIVDTIVAQSGRAGLHYLDRFGKTVSW